MDYWPNEEGAAWFADAVLPLVKAKIPDAHFYVVGAGAGGTLKALSRADVTIAGEVSDMRPYIAHAAAVVAPLRIARGVQNKVLEAMAMARPTVATTAASRALAVADRDQLYIADDAAAFAEAVAAAATGADRDRIAEAGRAYVVQNHQWPDVLAAVDADLRSLGPFGAPGTPVTSPAEAVLPLNKALRA
jgi:glycosyltransferase involved in cell wall biosynthesis